MIDIIFPCYNEIKYIATSLDSIKKQTFEDWNLFIFDDGSTDGTLDYIEDWIKNEPRATLFKRKQSFVSNLNEGIMMSKSKYIARMDADDIMMPNRLEIQVALMEFENNIDVLGSPAYVIDENNKNIGYMTPLILNKIIPLEGFKDANQLIHPSILMRRDKIHENNILYDEKFKYVEDWNFWIDCILNKLNIKSISIPLIKYRLNPNGLSQTHKKESNQLMKLLHQKVIDNL